MTYLRVCLVAGFLATAPSIAAAQMPTVDPSGRPEETTTPAPPPPSTTPYGATATPPATATPAPQEQGEGDTGYYHYDDGSIQVHNGAVPPVHVVHEGDTLWDITAYYFSNPAEWSKVWQENPQIKDPHWIYPGDKVTLRPGDKAQPPAAAAGAKNLAGNKSPAATARPSVAPTRARPPAPTPKVILRQLAFIDADDIKVGAIIDGSPRSRMMLSAGDEVYLDPLDGTKLSPGQTFAIYDATEKVTHPDTGKVIGSYVHVLGQLEVVRARSDGHSLAVIRSSSDVIERGDRVGPIKRTFSSVTPKPGTHKISGTIVATLQREQLIGALQVVIIDRGSAEGLSAGNPLYLVRRGDAYAHVMGPASMVGQDDHRFPTRIIGQVLVVDVGRHTAICVVTTASQEAGIGDHVLSTPPK